MSTVVSVVTPPAVEPITLEEAKAYLRVDFADDDPLIGALAVAARRAIEAHSHRVMIATTFDWQTDGFPLGGGYFNRFLRGMVGDPNWFPTNAGILQLPRVPAYSLVSITYLDTAGNTQTADLSNFTLKGPAPAELAPRYGFLWPVTLPQIGAVTIRFVAGEPDASTVPDDVKIAMKMLLSLWYENRTPIAETAGQPLPFAIDMLLSSVEWGCYG